MWTFEVGIFRTPASRGVKDKANI